MQTQCEECVGITSLSADQSDAQTLLGYNRGHWSIETVHRILNDTNNWNEDQCRIRTGPENVNAHLLLYYLRLTKNTDDAARSFYNEFKRRAADAQFAIVAITHPAGITVAITGKPYPDPRCSRKTRSATD